MFNVDTKIDRYGFAKETEPFFFEYNLQDGPLPVVDGVITPISVVIGAP